MSSRLLYLDTSTQICKPPPAHQKKKPKPPPSNHQTQFTQLRPGFSTHFPQQAILSTNPLSIHCGLGTGQDAFSHPSRGGRTVAAHGYGSACISSRWAHGEAPEPIPQR